MGSIQWETSNLLNDDVKLCRAALEAVLKRKDLGFWQLPSRQDQWQASDALGKELRGRYQRLVVLGQGGSALGGKLLVESLGQGDRQVDFLNENDPGYFLELISSLQDPHSVAWLVISKSGGTIEVLSLLSEILRHYENQSWNFFEHCHVITEQKPNPLRNWAEHNGVKCVDHPLDVGGRFSALSPVGLVPGAFSGVSLGELREGAKRAVEKPENWLAFMAEHRKYLAAPRFLSVFWAYSRKLYSLLPWIQQLWAESLGKSDKLTVSTPILSYGSTDQHSVLQQYMEGLDDKVFTFFVDDSLSEQGGVFQNFAFKEYSFLEGQKLGEVLLAQCEGTAKALKGAGRPVQVIRWSGVTAKNMGESIMAFELMVACFAELLGFNAFDQPGVELGKNMTKEILISRNSHG